MMARPPHPNLPHDRADISEYLDDVIANVDKTLSDEVLKKSIHDLNSMIQTKGSDEVINLWDRQRDQIQAAFNQQAILDIFKIKIIIKTLLNELKMLNETQSSPIPNSLSSNKTVPNLYERISHFVQARKDHRAVLRQEKNDQLNKIDKIIQHLHLIKKILMQNPNENDLNDLKNEVSSIKEEVQSVSKSRAYQKSNTVMMNADSAMTKLSTLYDQIEKKIALFKTKKRAQIPSTGIMRRLMGRTSKKVELKSVKNENPGNEDPSSNRPKNK